MNLRDHGRRLAAAAPPLTDAQALEFAQILLGSDDRAAA